MWLRSISPMFKRCNHSLDIHIVYNRSTYPLFRNLLCYNSLVLSPQRICTTHLHIPWTKYFVPGFPSRKVSSESVTNDSVGEDPSVLGIKEEKSDFNANEVYRTIMENAGCDKNMEKALEQTGIPLTTDLVVEILHRLRFEDKVAFRFFMWAGSQENYQHEYQVYNEMIDILSSTKFKLKQYRIICSMLDYMKRNDKKSVPVDVLVNILKKYTEKYLTEVKKFPKKKRIWVKAQPEVNALNLLLEALCKCCLVETAENMVNKVKNKIVLDVNTFNILLFGWCRVRNSTKGMKILEEMTSMGFTPDIFTYNTVIDTFCRAGLVNEASELFKLMKKKGSVSSPTAKTFAIMILALIKSERVEEGFAFVADMVQSGCLPDVSTYKELIQGICTVGKVEDAYRFLDLMAKKGFPPDIVTYNCFLKVLCDKKLANEALRLYDKIIEVGCMPSVHTFNMLIEMFFATSDPDGAFETWDEMGKRCNRDTNTYCTMIEGLFGCNKIDDACFLLEDVVNKGMKLPYQKFDLFLMHLSATGNLHAIHRLSEHMRSFYNPGMARRFALSQKRKSLSLRRD